MSFNEEIAKTRGSFNKDIAFYGKKETEASTIFSNPNPLNIEIKTKQRDTQKRYPTLPKEDRRKTDSKGVRTINTNATTIGLT